MILANHGIVSSSGGVSFDTDALSFITAASITDATQKTAVNTLVTDLKTYNIWTKMVALYPFVGGSATSHKFNLKDPRDLDAAYRLTFGGGMTHSSDGLIPNGTTAYANTYLKPSDLPASDVHLSYYSKSNTTKGYDMGSYLSTNLSFCSKYDDGISYLYTNTGGGNAYVGANDTRAFFVANRPNSTTSILYRNTTKIINATKNVEIPNSINMYIGGLNFNGTLTDPTNKICAFSSIGNSLNDTEQANFYAAVQAYQTTLLRNN